MAKAPSDKTLLIRARRSIRVLELQLTAARDQAQQYRSRATKAEEEAKDWRTRFDVLLRRSDSADGERM